MALRLMEVEPREYTFVVTPTGNDPAALIAHWLKLGELLGSRVVPVGHKSLQGLIRAQRAIPNHAQRWCTKYLKLQPYYRWLATVAPATSYVGLRADEETRPGMIFPNANGITMRFPMQEWGWTLDHVRGYLAERGVEVPDRTDCKLCFWQKLAEWYELWRDDPEAWREGIELEAFVTAERGAPFTFRSPSRDTWPASLAELGARFAAGDVPTRSIDRLAKYRDAGTCRVCTL